jgi:hypothetical protein
MAPYPSWLVHLCAHGRMPGLDDDQLFLIAAEQGERGAREAIDTTIRSLRVLAASDPTMNALLDALRLVHLPQVLEPNAGA